MNANEINLVIDNLYEKMGIGIEQASKLIPTLAKYKIAADSMWLLFVSIVLFLSVFVFVKFFKNNDNYDEADKTIMLILSAAFGFVFLIIGFSLIDAIIGWVVAPEMSAIHYLLTQ